MEIFKKVSRLQLSGVVLNKRELKELPERAKQLSFMFNNINKVIADCKGGANDKRKIT